MKKKGTAVLISPEGDETVLDKSPTLEQAQQMVGGYVEAFNTLDDEQVLCNEDGRLKKLPFNQAASVRAMRELVGPVIFLSGSKRWT